MDEKCLQVDEAIRPLVIALRKAGIDTDWSCAGGPGHMVIRPTIQARTYGDWSLDIQSRAKIERVLQEQGIKSYWLSLTWNHGVMDTHGGESVWLIQIPGRFDFLALPVAYSTKYLDESDTIPIEEFQK